MKTTRFAFPAFLATAILLVPLAAAAEEPAEPPAVAPAPEVSEVPDVPEAPLFVPEPEEKGQCIYCEDGYATEVHWGMGDDCNQSLQDLENQVYAAAQSFCQGLNMFGGVCDANLVITGQCWYKPMTGQYVTDGYLSHGCFIGDYFCPEW